MSSCRTDEGDTKVGIFAESCDIYFTHGSDLRSLSVSLIVVPKLKFNWIKNTICLYRSLLFLGFNLIKLTNSLWTLYIAHSGRSLILF